MRLLSTDKTRSGMATQGNLPSFKIFEVVRQLLFRWHRRNNRSQQLFNCRIDHLLNDRPLKCLNWRTPREAFAALVARHVLEKAA